MSQKFYIIFYSLSLTNHNEFSSILSFAGPNPSIYHPVDNPLGQIFWLGDIVRLAGGNFTLLSIKGGVVSVSIQGSNIDDLFD